VSLNRWAVSVVGNIVSVCEYGVWLALLLAAIWALFEWRVRSENKTLMRLAAMGTGAVGLAVAAFLLSAALILPLIVLAGTGHRFSAPQIAAANTVKLDVALKSLDAAIAAKDWTETRRQTEQASLYLRMIWYTGLGQPIWETPSPEEGTQVDAQFGAAVTALREAGDNSNARDEAQFEKAMQAFRQAYGWLRPGAQTAPK
jgi:hypothetical protein